MLRRSDTIGLMLLSATLLMQGCAASVPPADLAAGTTGGAAPAPAIAPPAAVPSVEPAQPAEEGGTLATLKAMLPKGEQIIGTPTELYTRIARGALTCWFGASGPLKGGYVYHADAAPPSQGGRSEIIIRIKDKTAADPRSLRAFRIVIAPGETGSVMEIENVTITEPLATSLAADARRWAADDEGCSALPAATAWTAAPKDKAPDKAADKSSKTAKKKPAAKTAATKDN